MLRRAAQVFEQELGEPERAAGLWQQVLDLEPECPPAFDALERLYERLARHRELAELLERRAEWCSEAGELVEVQSRLARVLESRLADPDRAIETWRRILDFRPEHEAANEALERLLAQAERWGELAQVLARRFDWQASPARRARVGERLARLYEERLGDPERARAVRERLV